MPPRGLVCLAWLALAAMACGSDKRDGAEADSDDKSEPASAGAPSAVVSPMPTGPDPIASMQQPEYVVERVDDTRYIVDRDAVLQLAVDGIGGWLRATKVADGYRLDHTPDGSIAARLGFADGDVIVRVNDIALSEAAEVRRAYAVMRTSSELLIVVERGGARETRRYLVDDARGGGFLGAVRARPTRGSLAYEAIIGAIRTGVRRIAATDYDVDRAIMQMLAESPDILGWAGLALQGRSRRTRNASGVSITTSPSVLEELGLTPHDVIRSINGKDLEAAADLRIELAAQASGLKFTISVSRLDESLAFHYKIVDGLVDRARLDKAVADWKVERANDPAPADSDSPDEPDPDRAALSAKMDAAITEIDDLHYQIDRSFLDEVMADPNAISRGARIVPSMKNGKAAGFKLYAIRPSSFYAKVGLKNGDAIHSVNGYDVADADRALEAYKKVKNAKRVTLEITRRGKSVTMVYDIE